MKPIQSPIIEKRYLQISRDALLSRVSQQIPAFDKVHGKISNKVLPVADQLFQDLVLEEANLRKFAHFQTFDDKPLYLLYLLGKFISELKEKVQCLDKLPIEALEQSALDEISKLIANFNADLDYIQIKDEYVIELKQILDTPEPKLDETATAAFFDWAAELAPAKLNNLIKQALDQFSLRTSLIPFFSSHKGIERQSLLQNKSNEQKLAEIFSKDGVQPNSFKALFSRNLLSCMAKDSGSSLRMLGPEFHLQHYKASDDTLNKLAAYADKVKKYLEEESKFSNQCAIS